MVQKEDKIVKGADLSIVGAQIKSKLAEKVSSENIDNLFYLTSAQYEALTTKDPNTLYIITDGGAELYPQDGEDGKSAYQIWLDNGNVGTETDFLESLKGDTGVQIDEETFMGTIVNDLDTGGADKALSAQMGKALNENTYGYDTITVDEETDLRPTSANSGWKMSSGGTTLTDKALQYYSSSYQSYYLNLSEYSGKILKIKANSSYTTYLFILAKYPNSSTTEYTFQELIDGGYFASSHFNEGNFVRLFISANTEKDFRIPEDAKYLYIGRQVIEDSLNRTPQYIHLAEITHTNGAIDVINQEIEGLQNDNQSTSQSLNTLNETVFGTLQEVSEDGYLSADLIKCSIDSGTFYRNVSSQKAHVIDVEGYKKITITAGTRSAYFCLANSNYDISSTNNVSGATFASTYMATDCDGYVPNSGSSYRMNIAAGESVTITLSDSAKWLFVQKNFSDTSTIYSPSTISLIEDKYVGGLVDRDDNSESVVNSTLISLTQGYLNEQGNLVDDTHFVMTSPIPMSRGFGIELHEPYRVHGAMLFDNNGNLVNPREYYNDMDSPNVGLTRYGLAMILPQFNVRLRIGTSLSDGSVTTTDNIISRFVYLDDSRLHKMVPTNQSTAAVLGIAKRRAKTILDPVWTAMENASITNGSSNYARKGQVMHGIPYSEVAEYTKYVGQHVSVRTFLTAALNRRSLVYTETINSTAPSSQYGISYHGLATLSGAYYGTVCSGLTCYVQDLDDIKTSGTNANCTRIAGGDDSSEENYYPLVNGVDPFDLIEPLDLIWYTGHITIVTDVYLDENGDKKFFIWTEQTTPRTMSAPYTKETFKARIIERMMQDDRHAWAIYRYNKWSDGLSEPEEAPYVQKDFFDYTPKESLTIDPDITTFAGEYAAFSIGDPSDTVNNNKLYLNIHRGGTDGYTNLQIFNESDNELTATPIVELGILSGDSYVTQSDIYTEDAANKEDWIKYDLASYWYTNKTNTTGKFKARVVRKSGGSVVSYSGCTHFQMVDISFQITRNTDTIDCTFSSNEGSCYLIRQEKTDGMYNNSSDISTTIGGTKTLSWNTFGTYKYVKLFVRADYGVVVNRIDVSQLSAN